MDDRSKAKPRAQDEPASDQPANLRKEQQREESRGQPEKTEETGRRRSKPREEADEVR